MKRHPIAWMVRFLVSGQPCVEVFADRWRAEAFVGSCEPVMEATIVALAEVSPEDDSDVDDHFGF